MSTPNVSHGHAIDFKSIETLVNQGKTVISAEDSAIIDLAYEALSLKQ